jgi:hypothetical protein
MPDTILDRALSKITGEAGAPISGPAATAGTETPVQFAARPSFSDFLTNYGTTADSTQTQPGYVPPAAAAPIAITPAPAPAYNPTPAAPVVSAPITPVTPVASKPAAPAYTPSYDTSRYHNPYQPGTSMWQTAEDFMNTNYATKK